jgi:hypothetical protein
MEYTANSEPQHQKSNHFTDRKTEQVNVAATLPNCVEELVSSNVEDITGCSECKHHGFPQPTSGGRSVGIVRSRTEATEFSLYIIATLFLPTT